MARIIFSSSEPCGDGMKSTTTYDSNWCEHKEDRDYCDKCNIIIDKTITVTHKELKRLLKIKKGFKIQSIGSGNSSTWIGTSNIKISIRFKARRKK